MITYNYPVRRDDGLIEIHTVCLATQEEVDKMSNIAVNELRDTDYMMGEIFNHVITEYIKYEINPAWHLTNEEIHTAWMDVFSDSKPNKSSITNP